MGISVQEISLCEYIWSELFQEKSGVKEVITDYQKNNFLLVAAIARFPYNSWAYAVIAWY